MRPKRERKYVLRKERIQFQYVCAKKWFENFRLGILSVNDSSRSVQPTEINTDKIKVLVNENPCLPAQNIVDDFQISHKSILNHIRKID